MPHLFSLRPPCSQHWKPPKREECSSRPSRASAVRSPPVCPERCLGTPKPHRGRTNRCSTAEERPPGNHPTPRLVVPSRPSDSRPTALGKAHQLTSALHGKEGTSPGAEPLHKLPWARETRSSLYIMCHSGTMRPVSQTWSRACFFPPRAVWELSTRLVRAPGKTLGI